MSGFYWLASYPKSGNTWLRIFLANLLSSAGEPVDINRLSTADVAHSREHFDDMTGIESSDLLPEEIESLRPAVFRALAERSRHTLFFKAHDAYTKTPRGEPLFPADVTRGALYILRNPFDLAVSFAHHNGCDIDTAITCMADEDFCLAADRRRLSVRLPQRLTSWSDHVRSWLEASGLRLRVLRYEDMSSTPASSFMTAARFVQIPANSDEVRAAVAASSFRELARQESAGGFREGSRAGASFFRRGEVGSWRRALSQAQRDRLIDDHGDVMREVGYLDQDGRPVF